MDNIPKDLASTFAACFSYLECLLPAPSHEEVTLGARRFRLLREVKSKYE